MDSSPLARPPLITTALAPISTICRQAPLHRVFLVNRKPHEGLRLGKIRGHDVCARYELLFERLDCGRLTQAIATCGHHIGIDDGFLDIMLLQLVRYPL